MNETTNPATRLHHPYSPSKLQYLEASPFWESRASNTEAAQAGTAQHAAVDEHDLPEHLSDKQAMAVAFCKDYWAKLADGIPDGTTLTEIYVRVDDEKIVGPDGKEWLGTTAGYLDRARISADGKRAVICDWKFGMWSVEPASNNLQGIAYLLGLVREHPSLEEVEVHFVLPHRNEQSQHTFRKADFSKLYQRVRSVVLKAIAARGADTSACNVTTSSCIFCANIGRCKAVARYAGEVGKKFAPLLVPENISPTLIYDPAQARIGLELAAVVGAWAEAYRTQATLKAVEYENFIPEGYRLRERAKREVKDWRKVFSISRKWGLKAKELADAISVSMTPLNTAIRSRAQRGEKEKAEEAFRDDLLTSGALEEKSPVIFLERIKT